MDEGEQPTGVVADDAGQAMSGAPDPVPSDAATTILGLSDDLLPALIARLDASELGELEVSTDAWRVRLRRAFDRHGPAVVQDGRRRRPAERAVESHDGAHPGQGSRDLRPSADRRQHGTGHEASEPIAGAPALATSPAVGYFVPRDGWGAGRHVRSGDVVGYVDCLGVRQDVVAPADGFLGRLLAQPGEAVEYGQPLVNVDLVDGRREHHGPGEPGQAAESGERAVPGDTASSREATPRAELAPDSARLPAEAR